MINCIDIFNGFTSLISIIIALLAFKLSNDTVRTQKSIEILKLRLSIMEELRKYYNLKVENINDTVNINKIRISIISLFGKELNYYVNILIEVLNTYQYRIGFDDETKAEWIFNDIKNLFNLIMDMMSEKDPYNHISFVTCKNADEVIKRLNGWHKKLNIISLYSNISIEDSNNKDDFCDKICKIIKLIVSSIAIAILFSFILKFAVFLVGTATKAFTVGNVKLNIMLVTIFVMYVYRKLCKRLISIVFSEVSCTTINKVILTSYIVLYFATYINGTTWFSDLKDYNIQIITLYFMLYSIYGKN